MSALFDRNKSTISRHIKNIFSEGELNRNSVVANFATTANDGKTYNVDLYMKEQMQRNRLWDLLRLQVNCLHLRI